MNASDNIVYCVGSLNLDFVYQVDSVVRPGETISAGARATHLGGKGANQSIALAKAGARVRHIGRIGPDGMILKKNLEKFGIDTSDVTVSDEQTGHAVIQVSAQGENAIIVFGGANHTLTEEIFERSFSGAKRGDWLVIQNETNAVAEAMRAAQRRKMKVVFNPSPLSANLKSYGLDQVDLFVVNQAEGEAVTEANSPESILEVFRSRYPKADVVLTLGEAGAWYSSKDRKIFEPARKVLAIDTTAAGDTFLGFFVATLATGTTPEVALQRATAAAAICVTRPGASDSIPDAKEVF